MSPFLLGFTDELVKTAISGSGVVEGAGKALRGLGKTTGETVSRIKTDPAYRQAIRRGAAFGMGQNAFMGMFMGDRKESLKKRLMHAGIGGGIEGGAMALAFPRMFMAGH